MFLPFTSNLRWDTLSLILSHGGIYPGARVLVFESLIGLMVGSLAYRMRGNGSIVLAYCGQQPHLEMVDWLNLDEKDTSIIKVKKKFLLITFFD